MTTLHYIRQVVPPTEYGHDDVVARNLDGAASDEVDGVEDVSGMDQRVAGRSVR